MQCAIPIPRGLKQSSLEQVFLIDYFPKHGVSKQIDLLFRIRKIDNFSTVHNILFNRASYISRN